MKLSDIILESAIKWVYHIRSLNSGVEILKRNFIYTSRTMTQYEKDASKNIAGYYLSLAREVHSDFIMNYARNKNMTGFILFKIDNQKLSQRYKVFPTNYFYGRVRGHEAEERLVTDKPLIKNFLRYVVEIHIYADPKNDFAMSQAVDISAMARKRGIDVYYYYNKDHAMKMRKNKSVSLNAEGVRLSKDEEIEETKMTEIERLIIDMMNGDCNAFTKYKLEYNDMPMLYNLPYSEKFNEKIFNDKMTIEVLGDQSRMTTEFSRKLYKLTKGGGFDWIRSNECIRDLYMRLYAEWEKYIEKYKRYYETD